MEETYLLKHPGVKKKILHGGRGPLPHFLSGTKLVFHFQTLLDNFERTVIDDSRKNKQPTEIFVGKMFKMEVWEVLLTSMRIGEVAEFWCDAIHTGLYPMVSKGMRLAAQGRDPLEGQRHMCGMGNVFHYHSTGFPELNELMREPQPLIFIMELISVGEPCSYHQESWLMGKDEKMQLVPSLHLQGNALVRERLYQQASEKYKEAVLLLRIVQSREMPGDEDYIKLSKLIIPLVLNYCQCMLELGEYYEVIEHTTELIDKHKDCVKAYYKRAKAYVAVWSEKEAKRDFLMVSKLDITLARLVQKELQILSERMKEKYWEDKEMYWKVLDEKDKDKGKAERDNESEEGPVRQVGLMHQNENVQCSQKDIKEEKACISTEGVRQRIQMKEPSMEDYLTKGNNRQQMLRLIMLLQDEGTFYIKERRFFEAVEKFTKALEYVDYIQSHEVDYKGDDWESLDKVRLPLTLNLSQCKLELGEYQVVVETNTTLLKTHKDNLKAIYQRARAHAALYNENETWCDFSKAERLDPQLKPIIKQELKKLSENLRAKHAHEKKNYWTISREKLEREEKLKQFQKNELKCGEKSKNDKKNRDKGQAMKIGSSDNEQHLSSKTGTGGQAEETNVLNEEQKSTQDLMEKIAEPKHDEHTFETGTDIQAECRT